MEIRANAVTAHMGSQGGGEPEKWGAGRSLSAVRDVGEASGRWGPWRSGGWTLTIVTKGILLPHSHLLTFTKLYTFNLFLLHVYYTSITLIKNNKITHQLYNPTISLLDVYLRQKHMPIKKSYIEIFIATHIITAQNWTWTKYSN